MTVNELKYVYIEETMSALGNEELMEAILDAVRKVKVKFQEDKRFLIVCLEMYRHYLIRSLIERKSREG